MNPWWLFPIYSIYCISTVELLFRKLYDKVDRGVSREARDVERGGRDGFSDILSVAPIGSLQRSMFSPDKYRLVHIQQPLDRTACSKDCMLKATCEIRALLSSHSPAIPPTILLLLSHHLSKLLSAAQVCSGPSLAYPHRRPRVRFGSDEH